MMKSSVNAQRRILPDAWQNELRRVLEWSDITRGIAFAGVGVGWMLLSTKPGTMGDTICNDKGDPLFFRSFHELLQWLFDQPEIER